MSTGNLVVALAVLGLILSRQLRKRAVREDDPYRLMLVLDVVGVVETARFTRLHDVNPAGWAVLAASLAVGAGFGLLRGLTVRIWREAGTLYRQGNALTLVLWLVGLSAHIGVDLLLKIVDPGADGIGKAALLLYLAITLGVQQVVVLERAERQGETVRP